MNGFKDASFNKRIAENILKHILSKLCICMEMMNDDCIRNKVQIENNEIIIRDYLFSNYLNQDEIMERINFNNFRFFPEAPENYTNGKPCGRADLQVFSEKEFSCRKKYFVIECKRIDGSLTLNRNYINEGIRRFVHPIPNPKYSSFYKLNGMIGFVVKEIDLNKNVETLNALLQSDYNDIDVVEYMKLLTKAGTPKGTYYSIHKLAYNETLMLYHTFLPCQSILK